MADKYLPTIGLDAIKILGKNMYSNSSYALSELIANSHDAHSKQVWISFDANNNEITILDSGVGMSEDDISTKYLNIGSDLRGDDDYKMGRKGIGKLASLFISDEVRVLSKKNGKVCGLLLSLDREKLITENGQTHFPSISQKINDREKQKLSTIEHGTLITLSNMKEQINIDELIYTLSDMFDDGVIEIYINGKKLSLKRKTMPNHVVSMVVFGDEKLANIPTEYRKLKKNIFNAPEVPGYKEKIHGWVVVFDSINMQYLKENNIQKNNDINKISIFSRGKIGLDNVLQKIDKSRVADRYISGYINAPIFEEGDADMALPNRQGYNESDDRFKMLLSFLSTVTAKLSKDRSIFAEDKKAEEKAAAEKVRKEKVEDITKRAMTKIEAVKNIDNEGIKTLNQVVGDIVTELGVGNIASPVLLVSHSEKDKDFAEIISEILSELGFVTAFDEDSTAPKALISSVEGWGTGDGVDFWKWVIDNCIKHISNQPARVLILNSKNAANSFYVGVEAGIARAAAENANKQVVTIDDMKFNDVRGIFKKSTEQTINSMMKNAGKEEEKKILTNNLFLLLETYPNPIAKKEIYSVVSKSIDRNRDKLDNFYSSFDKNKEIDENLHD